MAPAVVIGYAAGSGCIALGAEGLGAALAVVGGFAWSWFALVLAAAAVLAAWIAVALLRTRARAPRWPWQNDREPDA